MKTTGIFSLAVRAAQLAVLLLSTEQAGRAQTPSLELASPFVNDVILQREMRVPVWGWAKPGTELSITFAGQSKATTASEKGEWIVRLDPLKASHNARQLTVTTAAGNRITVTGVLVGEVWFASGQSNMDWIAGKSLCRDLADMMRKSKTEIPIREYLVDTGSALFPDQRADCADGWKRARHHSGGFSALALSFSWSLYQQLKVPIGILRSTHGATQIETWTPYEGFAAQPHLQDIAAKIRRSDPSTADGKQAYAEFYDSLRSWQKQSEALIVRGGAALPRPSLPGIAEEWRGPARMYNKKIAPLIPFAIRGAIWCQGTHNAEDGRSYTHKMDALVKGLRANWGQGEFPFYFTQMQCYGVPDPNSVGFADIREAQRGFFMNANKVGMVLQHDLNPKNPKAIHNANKLDPGKRLARWALAHEYGMDIAYSGPLYKSHRIVDNTIRVQFEQRGKGGGLMVGSKGMEGTASYIEPAKETLGAALRHFRLAGSDMIWHAAEAVIDGSEVVVTSKAVSKPVGVQYAYSASPIDANLYNEAGLPATPFAYFDGRPFFQEDDPVAVAALEAKRRSYSNAASKKPYLQLAATYRDHAVVQRDKPVPVWGFALPGTEITVTFGGQTKKATAGEFDTWKLKLDAMPASTTGRDLVITSSNGPSKTVKDIVLGDVWILTGKHKLTDEFVIGKKTDPDNRPHAMPLLREFRIKTKARRFRTPRKRRFEIGGGKYVASWQIASLRGPRPETTMAAYHFAKQVQEPNVPIGIITLGADNPPLTWTSYAGIKGVDEFKTEWNELSLLHPDTEVCKAACVDYIEAIKKYTRDIIALRKTGEPLPAALLKEAPSFPQPYYNQWANKTETAGQTYNFCVSPLTPLAVRGVVWIPGKANIGENAHRYSAALRTYAASCPATYGQIKVAFVYAQPSSDLVDGLTKPEIEGALCVDFDQWPTSVKQLATELGILAARASKD